MNIENLNTTIALAVHLMPGISDIVYKYNHKEKKLTVLVNNQLIKVISGDTAQNSFNSIKSYRPDDDAIERKVKVAVSEAWGFPFENLAVRTRVPETKEYRQIVMWWMKHNTIKSDAEIGSFCGGYEHATVLNAAKRISEWIDNDKKVVDKVELFLKAINDL